MLIALILCIRAQTSRAWDLVSAPIRHPWRCLPAIAPSLILVLHRILPPIAHGHWSSTKGLLFFPSLLKLAASIPTLQRQRLSVLATLLSLQACTRLGLMHRIRLNLLRFVSTRTKFQLQNLMVSLEWIIVDHLPPY